MSGAWETGRLFFVVKMCFFCYIFSLYGVYYARIAQLVEHITDTDGVPGSNPGARTLNSNYIKFTFGI